MTGPTSGSDSSSTWSARVEGHEPARGRPGGRRGTPAAPAATARRRRHAHQDLLAVDEDPGQVEARQVDPGPRPAGGFEGVDDAAAGVEHGDARAPHLAGHVDDDLDAGGVRDTLGRARLDDRLRPARSADP